MEVFYLYFLNKLMFYEYSINKKYNVNGKFLEQIRISKTSVTEFICPKGAII